MEIFKFSGLILMLLTHQGVDCNELLDAFIGDVISTFGLTSPTLVYASDEAPDICRTYIWVSCLNQGHDQKELAEHIVMQYKKRKQDGIIFTGASAEFVKTLELLQPSMFRSDCPVFTPLELSNALDLRLDTNVLFYGKSGEEFNVVDKFTVNGGSHISLKVASWVESDGIILERRTNRWERRTDLMGSIFLNTLWPNSLWADFIYNDNGTIIGSKGWFQEKLFYITDALNLSVLIREEIVMIDDKLTKVPCPKVLLMNLTDVCSGGMPINAYYNKYHDMPIATDHTTDTLLAGAPTGTAPDAWVYLEVFGIVNWMIFLALLMLISLVWLIINVLSNTNSKDIQIPFAFEGFLTAFLFMIQSGSHPENVSMIAKRILGLVTSMITLLWFIYYSNDITSKMTAGPQPIPVRTFQDVLDLDYKVILVGYYYYEILRDSRNDSAMKSVYNMHFKKYEKQIASYESGALKDETGELANNVIKWWEWTQDNLDWAEKQIRNDPKALFFCAANCVFDYVIRAGDVIALKMDDPHNTFGGFALRKDSEYLSVFNHYLLKGKESGVFHRLDKMVWNAGWIPPIRIGLLEPEALGIKSLIFPFSCLGGAMFIPLMVLITEKIGNWIQLHCCK